MRVRQRRPKHTREPSAWRMARRWERWRGNTCRHSWVSARNWTGGSLGVRTECEGVLFRAQEAIAAGDLLGERGYQAFAVDGDVELLVDAIEDVRDMQGGARLAKYGKRHINLRHTFRTRRFGGCFGALTEASDGAQLRLKGGFKDAENNITDIVTHGGLLSI